MAKVRAISTVGNLNEDNDRLKHRTKYLSSGSSSGESSTVLMHFNMADFRRQENPPLPTNVFITPLFTKGFNIELGRHHGAPI